MQILVKKLTNCFTLTYQVCHIAKYLDYMKSASYCLVVIFSDVELLMREVNSTARNVEMENAVGHIAWLLSVRAEISLEVIAFAI